MAMITREDLLQALDEYYQGETHEDALTSRELCKVFKLGINATRQRIHALVEAGVLTPVRTRRRSIAGVVAPVTAYRLTGEETLQ